MCLFGACCCGVCWCDVWFYGCIVVRGVRLCLLCVFVLVLRCLLVCSVSLCCVVGVCVVLFVLVCCLCCDVRLLWCSGV